MSRTTKTPLGASSGALPDVAENKRHAIGEVLQTIERLYKDRPFLAFLLVRDAIQVLNDRKKVRPWLLGGSITLLGSGRSCGENGWVALALSLT